MTPALTAVLMISSVLLFSCSKNDDDNNNKDPENSCYVQLFDGDNYTDDNIIVKGPGEYSSLSNLPGSDKDWNDEADSFKSGKNTTVTFFTKPNFAGDSVTYKNGAKKPSIDEPGSMKITAIINSRFTVEESKRISGLNPKKASRPDKISNRRLVS